ncbi:MAG TPA: PEP/pyruvate-binding domain-containing protein, partial [Ferruginibacter sp.]|nr:PEP/pyruvate-binding domain-containing protein [Ferruginibacter sp.]
MTSSLYLADLDKVSLGDIDQVGGKNASLGEMLQNLTPLGIQVPTGFVITVAAYREFLKYNNLDEAI